MILVSGMPGNNNIIRHKTKTYSYSDTPYLLAECQRMITLFDKKLKHSSPGMYQSEITSLPWW